MIGELVKKRRLELGLTQDELAKRMGYKSKSTINKIEKNINDVSQSNMVELARALSVDVSYFIYGVTKEDCANFDHLLNKDGNEHLVEITGYKRLNEHNKNIINTLVKQLLESQDEG